ncbi:MAG: GxxExxY protein [Terriglobales bacterium]
MNIYHGGTESRREVGLLSEALTESIIGSAIEVHRELGPGLLESVYQECLCQELRLREIPFLAQVELPINYKGVEIAGAYRIDLIVADEVVVELKSVERLLNVYEAQLLTYLKLTGKHVGLIIILMFPFCTGEFSGELYDPTIPLCFRVSAVDVFHATAQ